MKSAIEITGQDATKNDDNMNKLHMQSLNETVKNHRERSRETTYKA
jgi:hypothetical protein